MNKLLAVDKETREVMEVVKVKIFNAIKYHLRKGYKNRNIVMDKQHSYHIEEDKDMFLLYNAVCLLEIEFKANNIPITIDRIYQSGEKYFFGPFDVAIEFTINKQIF